MSKHAQETRVDQAIEQRLRAHYRLRHPSPGLWERIVHSAHGQQRSQDGAEFRTWRSVAAAITLVAIIAALTMQPWQADTSRQPVHARLLIDELHTFNVSERGLDVAEEDRDSLWQWFARKVEFNPPLPPTAITTAKLVGGRLCQIQNRRMVAYMYDVSGTPVSLYIADDGDNPIPAPGNVERFHGYGHAAWHSDGLRFALVGALSDAQLRELATAFRRAEEQPSPQLSDDRSTT